MTPLAYLPAAAREHEDRGWVESWRSFPGRVLRDLGIASPLFAIAEDVVQPGRGFGRHGHHDMEIISYPIAGTLAHQDSTGRSGVLRPGELQRMTAGSGIAHSEMNASATEPVHFLQIWIEPQEKGLEPGYEHRAFRDAGPRVLLAAPEGALARLHQSLALWRLAPADGETIEIEASSGAPAWLHVVRGQAEVGDLPLAEGDGAALAPDRSLRLTGRSGAELLLFMH